MVLGLHEAVHEGRGHGEAQPPPQPAGRHPKAGGQVRLVGTGLPQKEHRLCPGEVLPSARLWSVAAGIAGASEKSIS
jgi:hypothetical protein